MNSLRRSITHWDDVIEGQQIPSLLRQQANGSLNPSSTHQVSKPPFQPSDRVSLPVTTARGTRRMALNCAILTQQVINAALSPQINAPSQALTMLFAS